MSTLSSKRLAILSKHFTTATSSSPSFNNCLIANRGEIAIRIANAARLLHIQTVSIYHKTDINCLHVPSTTVSQEIISPTNVPIAAYLDIQQLINIALQHKCDCIHPGYGFLSENSEFAAKCQQNNITFIGPSAENIALFGDKVKARELAISLNIPVVPGSPTAMLNSTEAAKFVSTNPNIHYPILLKASAGGGGRGIRIVKHEQEMMQAFNTCSREAKATFGDGSVFVEQYVTRPRHVEVQIIADSFGNIFHLYNRDCSVQLRNQKVIEIAPAPNLDASLCTKMYADAIKLCKAANYQNVGTVEFLVDEHGHYYFLEVNPRIQVEHTVTEQVMGLDLVSLQFQIAAGRSLVSLGLGPTQTDILLPRGYAIQARVVATSAGTITAYKEPSGNGVRVDACGYLGYKIDGTFDPLLAKVICFNNSTDLSVTVERLRNALKEFHLSGISTNIDDLYNILDSNNFINEQGMYCATTAFLKENPEIKMRTTTMTRPVLDLLNLGNGNKTESSSFSSSSSTSTAISPTAPEGCIFVTSPLQGFVVELNVKVGDIISNNAQICVLLSMKMEHVVQWHTNENGKQIQGKIQEILIDANSVVEAGVPIVLISLLENNQNDNYTDMNNTKTTKQIDLNAIRPDLAQVIGRHEMTLDQARYNHSPAFSRRVKRRKESGLRTARENIEDLVDPDTFVEYGSLRVAGQLKRRTIDELIKTTPADGIVTGIGVVNGELFQHQPQSPSMTRTGILSYDYTVLAGTQGGHGHAKTDRILEICERNRLPVIFFCEGGGGRPGDTDFTSAGAGLACSTFGTFGRLSGFVPLVGLTCGYCFAGNAALLGCCDVIIATKGSNIGMGGPAMIEGGGLGIYKASDIGPSTVQELNGVIDILVQDEQEGVQMAQKYLSYFQGCVEHYLCADQRLLRNCVPENRLRVYDMKNIINVLVDTNSALYLRPKFGIGIFTALARFAGRPIGIIANNPTHLGGAIDCDSALKAARFIELCDGFDLPILSLIDCPGFMVGPDSEKDAAVRKFGKMFVVASSISVPFMSVVIRKAYGLGAQAMAGGQLMGHEQFTISWPTGEFGGMGLEGAVKLGYKKELQAAFEKGGVAEEKKEFDLRVAHAYENGKALRNMSELDDVVDPAETRKWILMALDSNPPLPMRRKDGKKKRSVISTW